MKGCDMIRCAAENNDSQGLVGLGKVCTGSAWSPRHCVEEGIEITQLTGVDASGEGQWVEEAERCGGIGYLDTRRTWRCPPLASLLSCLSCSQSPWASTAQPLPPQISRPGGHVGAWPGAHGPTAAALSSRHSLQASVSIPNVENGGNNMKCDKHLTSPRLRSR